MATVLIIEDDGVSALCLKTVLQDAGHSVSHASTTNQAADLLSSQLPDILISDWAVDGPMTVVDLALNFRKRSTGKILFTTGYSKDHLEKSLSDLRNYEIFVKPLNFDDVLQACAE